METITLQNGVAMPMVGYGLANNTGDTATTAVKDAINVGYRLIDTAVIYDNEADVGAGIKASGVDRSELFITTKVWVQDMSFDGTMASVNRSLELLDTSYLDLVLLHQPVGDVFGAWRALISLYKAGKIKAIGVSNFSTALVKQLIELTDVAPMLVQLENHPFRNQEKAVADFKAMGLAVEAWAPFAEGMHDLFHNEQLLGIATAHQRDVGQVILRWQLQRGIITIPKTLKPTRMASNLDIFDFELTETEMSIISGMNTDETLFGVSEATTLARVEKLLGWTVPH
jgi:diketogulonate reductase-like aldo/keto reductase